MTSKKLTKAQLTDKVSELSAELKHQKAENEKKDSALKFVMGLVEELNLKIAHLENSKLRNEMGQGEMAGAIDQLDTAKEIIQIQARKIEKAISSALPKSLSDMPVDVLPKILGNLSFKELLPIRKVSRPLLEIIDKEVMDSKINSVSFVLWDSGFKLVIDGMETGANLSMSGDGWYRYRSPIPITKETVIAMVESLPSILKFKTSPLTKLEIIYAGCSTPENLFDERKIQESLESYLRSRPNILKVKKLDLCCSAPEHVSAILRYIEPRVLEDIRVRTRGLEPPEEANARWGSELSELLKTDHWKHLKGAELCHMMDGTMLLQHCMHLETCIVHLETITPESLIQLKEILTAPGSTMQLLSLVHRIRIEDWIRAFGQPTGQKIGCDYTWRFETSNPDVMLYVVNRRDRSRFVYVHRDRKGSFKHPYDRRHLVPRKEFPQPPKRRLV